MAAQLPMAFLVTAAFAALAYALGMINRSGALGGLLVGITTSGSPWWWMRLIRDPGRSLWTRGLRPIFHPRCRYVWRQLYSMNHRTEADRTAFLARVERTLARLGGPA